MLPVLLAGLGALYFSNPPRRKRRRSRARRNPTSYSSIDAIMKAHRVSSYKHTRAGRIAVRSAGQWHYYTFNSHGLYSKTGTTEKLRHNPRVSKTEVIRVIQTYYPGHGWEDVDFDDLSREGRLRSKENLCLYRENQPEYAHRLIRRRVPKGQ